MRAVRAVAVLVVVAACAGVAEEPTTSTRSQATSLPVTTTESVAATTASSLSPTATTVSPLSPPPLERLDTRVVASGEVPWVAAGVRLLDTAVPVNRSPGLFVFPDGRVRIVYMVGGYDPGRLEVIGSPSIRMATCTDPSCASVEIIELQNTAPFATLIRSWNRSSFDQQWVAFTDQGIPYWQWTGWTPLLEAAHPDFDQKTQIAACVDVDCAQVLTADLVHEYTVEGDLVEDIFQIALAPRPGGGIGFAYQYENPTGSSIHYAECDLTLTCSQPEHSATLVTLPNHTADSVSLGYSIGSLPLISYAPRNQGLWIAACQDVLCQTPPPLHQLSESDAGQWPGSILTAATGTLLTYQGFDNEGRIGLIWCTQTDCDDPKHSTLKTYEQSFAPFDAILRDGTPILAWTTTSGLELAICKDLTCSTNDASALGISSQGVSLAVSGQALLIAIINEDGVQLIDCTEASC